MKLSLIPLESIEVGERFRKKYVEIGELAYSIRTKGLITPIAVSLNSTQDDGAKPWLLAAGGRRLAAIKYILENFPDNELVRGVPCRIYDQVLTELEYRSIELAENIDRDDLKYHEKVLLVRQIHHLQVEIHGEKISKSPDAPGWSQADTANLIGRSTSQVADDLKLARGLSDFPALQLDQCVNKTEAMKRLQKFGTVFVTKKKAEEYQESIKSNGVETTEVTTEDGKVVNVEAKKDENPNRVIVQNLVDNYHVQDFFEGVKSLQSEYFQLIEVDPPYGVDLKETKSGDTYGYNEIEKSDYEVFLRKTFQECYRLAAVDSWIITWFAPDPWVYLVNEAMREAGFTTTLNFGAWYKAGSLADTSSGQNLQPKWKLANCYELFIYGWKGRPTLGKPGATNGFPHKPLPPSSKTHPTERPLDLMVDVLSTFGHPGDRVLVPFLGSGNSIIAAHRCSMYCTGFELTQMYKEAYIVKLFDMFKENL